MKIELKEITVKELTDGYVDNSEAGVVGYGGKLDMVYLCSGSDSESRITAFDDTWHWNLAAEARITHHRDTESTEKDQSKNLSDLSDSVVNTSYRVNGNNQMMAYLVMMAVRLKELHRVLKPTGSLYLHRDPTASHYL